MDTAWMFGSTEMEESNVITNLRLRDWEDYHVNSDKVKSVGGKIRSSALAMLS